MKANKRRHTESHEPLMVKLLMTRKPAIFIHLLRRNRFLMNKLSRLHKKCALILTPKGDRGREFLQRSGRGGGQMQPIKLGVGVIKFDGNFSGFVIQSTKSPRKLPIISYSTISWFSYLKVIESRVYGLFIVHK